MRHSRQSLLGRTRHHVQRLAMCVVYCTRTASLVNCLFACAGRQETARCHQKTGEGLRLCSAPHPAIFKPRIQMHVHVQRHMQQAHAPTSFKLQRPNAPVGNNNIAST